MKNNFNVAARVSDEYYVASSRASAALTTTITVDGHGGRKTFDGLGAISYGAAIPICSSTTSNPIVARFPIIFLSQATEHPSRF